MFYSLLKPHIKHLLYYEHAQICLKFHTFGIGYHKESYIAIFKKKASSCCGPCRGHCLWSVDTHPSKVELCRSCCELMGWIEGKYLSVERTPSPLQWLLIFPPAILHLGWWMAMVCNIEIVTFILLKRKSLPSSASCIPTLSSKHIKTIKAAP